MNQNMISKCFEDPRGTIPIFNDDSMIKKCINKFKNMALLDEIIDISMHINKKLNKMKKL